MKEMSLFTGYGGLTLGLRLAGVQTHTVLYCEINPYRQSIIRRRVKDGLLDDAPIWSDVRTLTVGTLCQLLYDSCDGELQEAIMAGVQSPKYDNAVALYMKGLSVGEVADYYGISRQAMWMILKRRGCQFRSNLKMGSTNHFFRGTSADESAHDLVERAIAKGILSAQPCEVCGANGYMADGRREVQAHHDDYNQPLTVRWLCQRHHHAWHMDNKSVSRKEVILDGSLQAIGIDVLTAGFP